ncbi:TPA: hypothetical protein DCE37_02150 [Candidatus Latescibacteria bacterium]|nr:hypothetical protein [Candidatus Latescibacterota bacterium]
MKSLLIRFAPILLIVSFLTSSSTVAVSPVIWWQDTQAAFSKGEADAVSITRDGEIRLGPSVTEFADTGEEFVWALSSDGRGRVFAGTGSEGRVYQLSDGSATLLFDSPERAIFSVLAVDGVVYAGSSPGGLVYAVPLNGEPKTLARTDDQHVWALIEDGKGGLLAATGGPTGRVLMISKSGDVSEVLATDDPNVVSLVRADDGTIYAGTDQNGLIYRVDPSGKADVLYDASEAEIKALVLTDGRLIAGASSGAAQPGRGGPPNPNGRNGAGGKPGGQSVVYSVEPTGSGWRLWDVPEPSVQALAAGGNGSVVVLTGGKGALYHLYADGSHSIVATIDDAEPWTYLSDGKGGGWVAASGSGSVHRVASSLAKSGTLTSEPEDFSLVTRWGRVNWDGDAPKGTRVAFEVRAGNSEVPDDTWSGWTAVGEGGEIPVRTARYIQYRATLSGDSKQSPSVREVIVSGLPDNIQPLIVDLAVKGPHQERAGGGGGNGGGGRRSSSPSEESSSGWEISWTGADVNNDKLTYALHYKGRNEKTWKLLAEDLTGNSYTWDTESAPEGTVLVRLTVSDAPSNPPDLARSSERISVPFKVDHTEPEVRISEVTAGGSGTTVRGSIKDATSRVKSASYALNSGDWTVMFPGDGIFDSSEESIALTLDGLSAGEYTLVIRASDARGNVGVAKHVFGVK